MNHGVMPFPAQYKGFSNIPDAFLLPRVELHEMHTLARHVELSIAGLYGGCWGLAISQLSHQANDSYGIGSGSEAPQASSMFSWAASPAAHSVPRIKPERHSECSSAGICVEGSEGDSSCVLEWEVTGSPPGGEAPGRPTLTAPLGEAAFDPGNRD